MPDSIIAALADMFPDEVLVEPAESIDGEGTITYGAAVPIPCKCSRGHRLARDRDGRPRPHPPLRPNVMPLRYCAPLR